LAVAVLFPGQGSQFPGMADPWTEHDAGLAVMEEASGAIGTDVVAAVDVGDQLVQQIPLIGDTLRAQVPEVMMGIADRNLRLQCRFLG